MQSPSLGRAELDMDGNENGTQGKDSGTDLNHGAISESPPDPRTDPCTCTCTCTCTCFCSGLRNVRHCARAGQDPCCDEHDQADHGAPRVKDPTWRLQRTIPRGVLALMDVGVGNLQVAVVLNMEQPTITDFVYHPNRLSIFSSIINETLVALHASLAQGDGVTPLEGRPHSYSMALQHLSCSCPSGRIRDMVGPYLSVKFSPSSLSSIVDNY
jgi:hypothetical protein